MSLSENRIRLFLQKVTVQNFTVNLFFLHKSKITEKNKCSKLINASLSNAMPLVSRFFAEMSKKRQRCAVVNLENNFSILQFTDVSKVSSKLQNLLNTTRSLLHTPGQNSCPYGISLYTTKEPLLVSAEYNGHLSKPKW
jgi:hypothetical protein